MSDIRDTISRFRHFVENATGKPVDELSLPNMFVYQLLRMATNAISGPVNDPSRSNVEPDISIEFTIPCLELERVDAVKDCPCAPPSGCFFMKSVYPLPAMNKGIPQAVTIIAPDCRNCNGENKEFTYVPWNDFQTKVNGRYKSVREGLYFTIKNLGKKQHLYVYTNSKYSDVKRVAVRLVPKDPLDLLYLPNCDPKPVCDVLSVEFYIQPDLEAAVFGQAMQLIGGGLQISGGPDTLANSNKDNRSQPSGG